MRKSIFNLSRSTQAKTPLRAGFTLVELLVVITIIAILAGLLIGAAVNAIAAAERTLIKADIDQMDGAFEDYKNFAQSYPANAQSNGNAAFDAKILSNFKRHLKRAYPQHREKDYLLEAIVGQGSSSKATNLAGGMTAAESLVFFLTKMSDDPRYPISGVGGPSYALPGSVADVTADPIDQRSWWLELSVQRMGPRTEEGFFDGMDERHITYEDPQDSNKTRQLNFWYYKDKNLLAPYVYFDTSRGSSATELNDVPGANASISFSGADAGALNQLNDIHAIKTLKSVAGTSPFTFANSGKFQILHSGRDEEWGTIPPVTPSEASQTPIYPTGPWTLELADTMTNFTDGTLEEAQP